MSSRARKRVEKMIQKRNDKLMRRNLENYRTGKKKREKKKRKRKLLERYICYDKVPDGMITSIEN